MASRHFNRRARARFRDAGERVAAPGITVVDDGTIDRRRGSLNVETRAIRLSAPCSSRTASDGLHAGPAER